MLKVDGCNADPHTMNQSYPLLSELINNSGRDIVYSCSWPAYIYFNGLPLQYNLLAKYCHLWRNFDDIEDSWSSVCGIMNYWGNANNEMVNVARPGAFNDPDMLIIGDFSLTLDEAKTQFAVWAILAAPLLMSNDLRNISAEMKEVLLNTEIIAVNQDSLGRQGTRVAGTDGIPCVWQRQLANGDVAIALVNLSEQPVPMSVSFDMVGLTNIDCQVRDLYIHSDLGVFTKSFTTSNSVPSHGVVMLRLIPQAASS
jgi:alpha-N-acetylgalactosaminidase